MRYTVCSLQALMSKAFVEDLRTCNQVLNYMKKTPDSCFIILLQVQGLRRFGHDDLQHHGCEPCGGL